jgi:hypothetical protein
MFKDYAIGLVVGPVGLNDNQIAEIKSRINMIMKAMGPGGTITLLIPALNHQLEDGVHKSVVNLQYMAGVSQMKYLDCGSKGSTWGLAFHELRNCDEVWCCFGDRQDHRLCRARVARIYQAGQASPAASKFKRIPSWVSAQEAPKNRQEKRKAKYKFA